MSHAAVLVSIPSEGDVEALVAEQMEPFKEDGEWFGDGTRWDWWVIGGRFSGKLDGYSPQKDPANTETCWLCNGTGVRWDDVVQGNCNGCGGTGESLKFSSKWKPHNNDVMRAADIRQDISTYAFLRNRRWHECERLGWFGGSAKTECEVSGSTLQRCITKCRDGARILTWNELYEGEWADSYWHRFIRPLPQKSRVAVVDYRV